MNSLATQAFISLALVLILTLVMQILNHQAVLRKNKNSPFECGFDPQESARLPFSLRFFLLAIIFLIFDIEIALLFPVILSVKRIRVIISIASGVVFLIILLVGLFHEWGQGTLRWIK